MLQLNEKLYRIKVDFLTFKSKLKKKPAKTYELKIAKNSFILHFESELTSLYNTRPPPFRQNHNQKEKKERKKGKREEKRKRNPGNKKLRLHNYTQYSS